MGTVQERRGGVNWPPRRARELPVGWRGSGGRVDPRAPALIAFCAFIASAGCSLEPGGRRPSFTGTWVLNRAESQLQIPEPDSTIFVVSESPGIVRIFRTHAGAGTLDTVTITLRPDSSRVDWELRGMAVTSRSWWEGNELVFWSEFSRGEQRASQVVRYALSANGSTLTAVEDVAAGPESHVNRWVFDRRK